MICRCAQNVLGRPSRGFSMIELIVVLVLLGITSGLAATSLRGTQQVVDGAMLQRQLVDFDQRVRQRAERSGAVRRVALDLDAATFTETGEDDTFTKPLTWSKNGGNGARVSRVWTPERGWVRRGQVTWNCSSDAVTPTYALELSLYEGQDAAEIWLVAGASGQWTRMDEGQRSGEIALESLRRASDG
ncbi:MAG: type II secretion system protein [Planctomycetota bacterium]